jgi:hypothetical protein
MKWFRHAIGVIVVIGLLNSCNGQSRDKTAGLDNIRLPEGFQIEVYAEVPNARGMALADDGT